MPGDIWGVVSQHEWFAQYIWLMGLVTGLLLVAALSDINWLRLVATTLAMASSLATAVWVGIAAHLGASLVYVHGVGLPEQAITWRDTAPLGDTTSSSENGNTSPAPSDDTDATDVTPIRIVPPDED